MTNPLITKAKNKIRQLFDDVLATKAAATAEPHQGLKDAKGRLCPFSIINPVDMARHALLKDRIAKAKTIEAILADYKQETERLIEEFIDVSNAEHGAKIGQDKKGKEWKGNLQLLNHDGTEKIKISVSDRITFTEQLNLAMQKIQSLIDESSTGANDILKALVQEAFRMDKSGYIDPKKVLSLRRHNIKHPLWEAAMQDIEASIKPLASKSYIQFYWRETPESEWQAIALDIARL